jgi:hypothetical protein
MSVGVSFVIPVLDEEGAIADLLRDLRQRYPHSQLIVVDGGSCDRTVALALPLCDQLLLSASGRACQMNLGGQVACMPYVFFLHADSCPSVSVSALEAYLVAQPAWGFCRVRLSGQRLPFRIIEWFMNQRSRITAVATGDQMVFVQKTVQSPCIIQAPVLTSSRRWEAGGVVPTVLRMWLLRFAYWVGVAPATLWRYYYGR